MVEIKWSQERSRTFGEGFHVDGEEMDEEDKFKWLRVRRNTDGGVGEEVSHRLLKVRKVRIFLGRLWKG